MGKGSRISLCIAHKSKEKLEKQEVMRKKWAKSSKIKFLLPIHTVKSRWQCKTSEYEDDLM